jgi:hypothetical protein
MPIFFSTAISTTVHDLKTWENIFESSSQNVVHGGLTIGGRGSFVKDEFATWGRFLFGLPENVSSLPELENGGFYVFVTDLWTDFIKFHD